MFICTYIYIYVQATWHSICVLKPFAIVLFMPNICVICSPALDFFGFPILAQERI